MKDKDQKQTKPDTQNQSKDAKQPGKNWSSQGENQNWGNEQQQSWKNQGKKEGWGGEKDQKNWNQQSEKGWNQQSEKSWDKGKRMDQR